MLEFGKHLSPELSTYKEATAAALVRTGCHAEAWVYVQLWSDWEAGVRHRLNTSWVEVAGVTEWQLRRCFRVLQELGVIEVRFDEANRRCVELRVGALLASEGVVAKTSPPLSKTTPGVSKTSPLVAKTSPPPPNAVSPCYVTLCEFGTALALTTTTSVVTAVTNYAVEMAVVNNAVETPEIKPVHEARVESVPAEPAPTVSQGEPKKRVRKTKPKRLGEVKGSQEFRSLAMAEIQGDSHWAEIRDLHEAWCAGLGKQYALNPWRYAAWRFALVENGYTAEQLQSAIPAVRESDWWRDHCSDPHMMFAKNPSKIEQFFPVNRTVRHNRFGVGAAGPPNEGFEF